MPVDVVVDIDEAWKESHPTQVIGSMGLVVDRHDLRTLDDDPGVLENMSLAVDEPACPDANGIRVGIALRGHRHEDGEDEGRYREWNPMAELKLDHLILQFRLKSMPDCS
jgi:hypothetical protein